MNHEPHQYEDSGWWRIHFSGMLGELWQSIVPKEQAVADADFILGECRLPPSGQILDVPCGNGRVALELAARGFRLVGVDISPEMIREARIQAELRGLSNEWREADMRSLPWAGLFDAAVCMGDSFGYLDDAGNLQYLEAVNAALKVGGHWVMELQMVSEVLMPRFRKEESGDVAGLRVHIQRQYHPQSGRLSVEYILTRAGKEERRLASYRIYSCVEICRMLERVGFEVKGLYGVAGEPFEVGSASLRIVAVKR